MRKKSNAKQYVVDGFVPRRRMGQRRATLDSRGVSPKHHRIDGFVPRTPEPDTPVNEYKESQLQKDEWSDDYSLTLGADDSYDGGAELGATSGRSRLKKEKKPHLWQIKKRREWRKRHPLSPKAKLAKRIFQLILIVAIIVGGLLAFKTLRALSNVFQGNVLQVLDTTKLKGEDKGRVNILLTGTSEDDPGHEGAALTDSIMILSLDTTNKTGFMMSIPRDLWVKYGEDCQAGYSGKINAAYECGESAKFNEDGYAKGGIGLLEKIIERDFGIDVNYYVKINYTAFREAIDTVGGVDINIKTDDPRGILDRNFDWQCRYRCYKVKYPNGPVHLNGEQALNLARARGVVPPTYGAGNDFGRTERQRQMLLSLKEKALSAGTLANPAKIASLLDSAGDNVVTDFKTNELRRLYELGKDVNSQSVKSIGLADEDIALIETDMISGQSVVVPVAGNGNFSQIKLFMKKLTSSDPILKEGAKVVVLNGSGLTGLAQKQADLLTDKGILVTGIGNGSAQPSTIIIDKTLGKKPQTKKLLERQLNAVTTTSNSVPDAASYPAADFIVILGKSAVNANTSVTE